jgi:hypothetical protein
MKNIKVRFKANISGFKKGEVADVSEDLVRRAGNDVELIESVGDKQKDLKASNKAMNKKQLKTK